MNLETNKKKFARLNKLLKGTDGMVYLMFAGRETYAGEIQRALVGRIYKHSANVNQAVERLLKHNSEFLVFKRKQREEGSRGRDAEIYTANLEPIYDTLTSLGVGFDKINLELVLTQLSEVNDYFPEYFVNIFDASVLRSFSWNSLFSMYLTFLIEVLNSTNHVVYPMPSDLRIDENKIALLLEKNPKFKNELITMFLQLSSPGLRLNPSFEAQISNVLVDLEKTGADLQAFVNFLNELKDMGITSFADLASQFREGMNQLELIKTLLEKTTELNNLCEKINKPKTQD